MSRPARGAWIETLLHCKCPCPNLSRPARGAWIETQKASVYWQDLRVAPRAGRVD